MPPPNVMQQDPDGVWRQAIPEPFWESSWRTWFRWRPLCMECRVRFPTAEAYRAHYRSDHPVDPDEAAFRAWSEE